MVTSSETIGPYKILKKLGEGGFAWVYLAQSKDVDEVALKVLKPAAVRDPNLVKRFNIEALTITKLNHPNIIRIFDTGHDEETFFIAMEYISGGNLRDRIKAGPLSRPETVHIVKGIGAALTCAHTHESNIIHRDLKPENILLDTKQELVRPVLTDFGLAKLLSSVDKVTPLTKTGSLIGTPPYMAPEQWNNETLTEATDLYALAMVFFEMLARRPSFEADTPIELWKKHCTEPLPLLSQVAPNVGWFFDDILSKAAAKSPADRFESVASFIKVLEEANNQAEQTEHDRIEQQKHAEEAVKLTQVYIGKGKYNPDQALAMIAAALEFDPSNVEALRLKGKIYLDQQQFGEALVAFKQAYEQVRRPSSEIGLEYLQALRQVAEISWQGQAWSHAAAHYHEIMQILGEGDDAETSIQEIRKEARTRLVEYHYGSGKKAYAGGTPDNLDEAIQLLEDEKQMLDQLKAESKIEELEYWCRELHKTRYKEKIKFEEKVISEIGSEGSALYLKDENIFQHYRNIDQHYQDLLKLEPDNFEWKANRRKKLREQAECRRTFAMQAESETGPDYEVAIRHYKAIRDIEQVYYPDLAEELHLNLDQKMAEMEEKADYYTKYHHIRALMSQGKHLEALSQLEVDFIGKGNYEFRDVAKILWELVYAKQHGGQFLFGWDGESNLEVLSEGLVRAERARLENLKVALAPWANFSKLIAEQYQLLANDEAEIKQIAAGLNEADAAQKVADLDSYLHDLTKVSGEIEVWRTQVQQIEGANVASPKVAAWLQNIERIEANLKEYYQVEEIQEFFSQNDAELAAIEEDPLFAALQTLAPTSLEVKQSIYKIQAQLMGILTQNINRVNQELTVTKSSQQKLNRQHELNKYLVPLSLALAVVAGGVIASQGQNNSPIPSVIAVIALTLLIAYFVYYVWVYYLPQGGNK